MSFVNNSYTIEEVRRQTPSKLLNCPNESCGKGLINPIKVAEFDYEHEWLLRLTCNLCNFKWSVCRDCSRSL